MTNHTGTLLEVREALEPYREIEMHVVGYGMNCCGNFTDGGECRSECVVQGEPEYEPQLVDGPVNRALSKLDAFLAAVPDSLGDAVELAIRSDADQDYALIFPTTWCRERFYRSAALLAAATTKGE